MSRLRLAIRFGALLCLALAAWNPAWFNSAAPVHVTMVLDESISTGNGPQSAWESLAHEVEKLPDGSRFSLIRFAAEPSVEIDSAPVETITAPYTPRNLLNRTATNIESALGLALGLVNEQVTDLPSRVVLVTDGHQTTGDATRLLEQVQASRYPTPIVYPMNQQVDGTDASIQSLVLPMRASPADEIRAIVKPGSNSDVKALLSIRVNDETVHERQVDLATSDPTILEIPLNLTQVGANLVEAEVTAVGDLYPDNNRRAAIVNLSGKHQVVYVSASGETPFSSSLRKGGWPVNLVHPDLLYQQLHAVNRPTVSPGVIVLDNVSSGSIPDPAWQSLVSSVRQRGTGLIVLGGDQSFGAGAYLDSLLESILPVSSRAATPAGTAAVLFVVDKSGSMGRESFGVTPFTYTEQSVIGAMSLLGKDDQTGIIAFDITPETWLPLARHADPLAEVRAAWRQNASGGTELAPALKLAAEQLAAADADQRLMILVTDGFSVSNDYRDALALIEGSDISVIALSIGDTNLEVLNEITATGESRIVPVSDALQLPRLVSEALGTQRFTFQAGNAEPREVSELPFLQTPPAGWPVVNGYMVTAPGPATEVFLESPAGDPLLAAHTTGLGRVVALPAGLGAFTPDWHDWSHWPVFTGGLVQWAGGSLGAEQVHVMLDLVGAAPSLTLDVSDRHGNWIEEDTAAVSLVDPRNVVTRISAERSAPGRFEADLPLQSTGTYRMSINTVSAALSHDFVYEAPGELDASNSQIESWRSRGLVDAFRPGSLQLNQTETSRGLFIILAIFLYVAALMPDHVLLSARARENRT